RQRRCPCLRFRCRPAARQHALKTTCNLTGARPISGRINRRRAKVESDAQRRGAIMKIETGHDDSLRKLGELIEDIEVAMLTTHADDGSLVSRPLQTLKLDANGELVFFTAADSHKVEELTNAGDANLAYADPGKKRYVSVRGRTRIDRDRATIDEL